jgi:aspartyl-tRNA(Asn)/glutamyl-tRNA(Gln) amidotransferase subunit C
MMTLTDHEFSDLETLAMIELEPEERDRLRLQLGRILGFVRRLQDVETADEGSRGPEGAAPSADEPGECLDRDEVLGQAPDTEGGYFRVPPVIDPGEGQA